MSESKELLKGDEGVKILLIELLKGQVTGGFDVDSMYCINDEYTIIEFLKCETVPVKISHPKFYLWRNGQKFISLWKLSQRLGGKLILINYELNDDVIGDTFKIMTVNSLDIESIRTLKANEKCEKCIDTSSIVMNLEEFKNWWNKLNTASLNQ